MFTQWSLFLNTCCSITINSPLFLDSNGTWHQPWLIPVIFQTVTDMINQPASKSDHRMCVQVTVTSVSKITDFPLCWIYCFYTMIWFSPWHGFSFSLIIDSGSLFFFQLGDLHDEAVEPLLCVQELMGSDLGYNPYFTSAFFWETFGDHHLSYTFSALNDALDRELTSLPRETKHNVGNTKYNVVYLRILITYFNNTPLLLVINL